jgi:V8-like Glu-specific endopeptidase
VIVPGTNNEGLTPYQKYNDYRVIETDVSEHLIWNIVHKFGYGVDDKPWQCQRHLTQQYSDGRIVAISYSAPYTVDFSADMRPGDSGGPVILRDSLKVIGIINTLQSGMPKYCSTP